METAPPSFPDLPPNFPTTFHDKKATRGNFLWRFESRAWLPLLMRVRWSWSARCMLMREIWTQWRAHTSTLDAALHVAPRVTRRGTVSAHCSAVKVFLSSDLTSRCEGGDVLQREGESCRSQFQWKPGGFCHHGNHLCLFKARSQVFVGVGSAFRANPCLKWLSASLSSSSQQR